MINSFSGRYSFLSNFYPCKILHQGITYPSVEHFYVAMKCNGPQQMNGVQYTPIDFREMLARIPEPGVVKKIGNKIVLRKDWEDKKLEFMNWAVREKFSDNKLAELLLMTGDEPLVEGNNWRDTFWGVCDGKGQNHLGKILMQVRDELRGTQRIGLEAVLGLR